MASEVGKPQYLDHLARTVLGNDEDNLGLYKARRRSLRWVPQVFHLPPGLSRHPRGTLLVS